MGKGGSTQSVTVPEWLEAAAKRNIGQGDKISRLGPVPLSYGPTVAAFTDSQIAGFDNTSNTASAFGLNAPGAFSMGTPVEYANGVRAYSAAPIYDQTMNAFAAARPGQKSYIDSFFIDPFSGSAGANVAQLLNYDNYQTAAQAAAQQQANDLAIAQATGPQVISTVNVDQQTGNFGQDNQVYNPDINYDDAYVASNNQIVGTLDPSQDSLNTMQDAYGVNTDIYTDENNPIYSSSDFPLGSSATGTDYTSYDTTNDNSSTYMNDFGSTVSTGYDVGEVDPGLASAAGYDTPTYNGSAEKNANVAKILKETYGWTDEQLTAGGYEGYAAEPDKGVLGTVGDAITDIVSASPTVQILNDVFNPATDYETFSDNYNASSADSVMNPTGVTYGNDDFVNSVTNSNSVSDFLPPVVSSNDNNNDNTPVGVIGNNDTGSNSLSQSLANLFTPGDGTTYVDGVLVNDAPASQALTTTNNNNDSGNDDSGGTGGDKIVCTEMYRQTQLDDWVGAMKTWYVYQKRHLTPYHQVGYHAIFRPFVKGMQRSSTMTKIGAYAASERTKHLRHVLTKGKAEDSLVGRVLCTLMEPPLYLVGRVVSAFRKDV